MKNSLDLKIKYLPVAALIPNVGNPKAHTKKQVTQLSKSIQHFEFIIPILADSAGNVIAGHGRLLAAKQLGLHQVPVIQVDHLNDAQIRAFMIADNKLTENAEWDPELLAQQFKILSELDLDFSLDITGFEMPEINMMIEGTVSADSENDPADEIPDIGNPVTNIGDLWLLGRHRLLCANSLEDASFALLMSGAKADMVFIDPPYNVPIDGHVSGSGTIRHREFAMASGEMSEPEFTSFLKKGFHQLATHSRSGSINFVCMDWRHMREVLDAGREIFTELKNLCVWVKDNGGMGAFYRSQHELVFVFKNGTGPHINNIQLGQFGRYRTNVWEYPGINSFAGRVQEGNALELHPTVKPVALVSDAIRDCSHVGSIILDSFLGSGTTLLAAERTQRVCYAIELDPLYVDIAIQRWQKLSGGEAVRAGDGIKFNELMVNRELINA